MIDTAALDIRDLVGLWVLEELGFGTSSRPLTLEEIVKATVGVVEALSLDDISDLVDAGGTLTVDVFATQAWTEWSPGIVGHPTAALVVIARLSDVIM